MTKRSTTHATFVIERDFKAAPAKVFDAFANPQSKAKWFGGPEDWDKSNNTFDLRVGGKVRLEFDNSRLPNEKPLPAKYKEAGKGQFEGVITRLEPNRLLTHTWPWKSEQSEVTYELTPRGKQVLLTIVHRRLSKELVSKVMGGWDVHSGILEDILNGVEPRPFWATHDKLEPEYAPLAA